MLEGWPGGLSQYYEEVRIGADVPVDSAMRSEQGSLLAQRSGFPSQPDKSDITLDKEKRFDSSPPSPRGLDLTTDDDRDDDDEDDDDDDGGASHAYTMGVVAPFFFRETTKNVL